MNTAHKKSAKKKQRDPQPEPNSARWKIGLSCLIAFQLLAIIAEPFQFFTRSSRGTSPAADQIHRVMAPYAQFTYVNHGYFFFAPEAGPSHLMQCQLEMPDGTSSTLRFPDRAAQWPRLLYHRHFMLAENLHQLWVPPLDPRIVAEEGDDDPLLLDWQGERARFEAVRGSMVDHVRKRYGAETATIERVEHRLPSDDEVLRQHLRLNDRRLYITLPDAPLENEITSQLPASREVPPE